MGIGKTHSLKKTGFQLLLLAVPTILLMCFVLWRTNNYYTILENEWLMQGSYFALGCIAAISIFSYRFRFITTTLLVFFLNYLLYVLLQNLNFGEFDSFYVSVKFYIFILLFSAGWLVGYGFSRSKYLTIIWSVCLLLVEIILISKTAAITVSSLMNGIVPILLYSFYIIYTTELVRNLNEEETRFGWFISKRLASFGLLVLILFISILSIFNGSFTAIEKEWGGASSKKEGGKKGGSESMTSKDKNGGVQNKDQSKLSGSLSKDKQLIFVAKLDHFFENSDIPNPLYFTSHYYTKFDTATQTFEVDDKMPYNDLFEVDPSKVPLYFKKTDETIIKKSLATLEREVVNAEVYNVNMAANSFLAPSTAFYCQPISVPNEFKKQYRSAYSAKMWVSKLNSAYFIYNPAGNTDLENFQQLRFEKLRQIENIEGPDKAFMDYYTYMPADAEYKKIGELAREITQNEVAPIDKIIAIRDYFLSKDEFDQPLYHYSDNPGIPGMPSANKLTYFLLENRKGYCAYFAGATLFMLRSLGIPSRVAVGYATADRSSKNPGWYWFYQDQAHAWVQVYFQGYGWIDFDTTIPDLNTQQASQPDGTPPTDVPATYLVIDGNVESTDTIKKQVSISSLKILYHDSEFVSAKKVLVLTDVSLASISNDTGRVTLSALVKGTHVTAVSHAEVLKSIFIKPQDSLESILYKLPKPVPIDEIKIIKEDEAAKAKKEEEKKTESPVNWLTVLYWVLGIVIFLGIVLLFCPWFIWIWLHAQAKKEKYSLKEKTFRVQRAMLYYLNQMGYPFMTYGPEEYAYMIDKHFGTELASFNRLHQKIKYSQTVLSATELNHVQQFYKPFIKNIKNRISFKHRLKHFLNLYRSISYFSNPKQH